MKYNKKMSLKMTPLVLTLILVVIAGRLCCGSNVESKIFERVFVKTSHGVPLFKATNRLKVK